MRCLKYFAVSVLLSTAPCLVSAQEMNYENFVAEIKKEAIIGRPASEKELKQLEVEAGLTHYSQEINSKYGTLKLADLEAANQFYKEKIKIAFNDHRYLDYLKAKFIYVTINTFDLTTSSNPEFRKYLVEFTRDLIQCRKGIDFQLYFQFTMECLSALKGHIPSDDFIHMVKMSEYNLRFVIETIEQHITELRADKSDQAKTALQFTEITLADVKAQRPKIELLMK